MNRGKVYLRKDDKGLTYSTEELSEEIIGFEMREGLPKEGVGLESRKRKTPEVFIPMIGNTDSVRETTVDTDGEDSISGFNGNSMGDLPSEVMTDTGVPTVVCGSSGNQVAGFRSCDDKV